MSARCERGRSMKGTSVASAWIEGSHFQQTLESAAASMSRFDDTRRVAHEAGQQPQLLLKEICRPQILVLQLDGSAVRGQPSRHGSKARCSDHKQAQRVGIALVLSISDPGIQHGVDPETARGYKHSSGHSRVVAASMYCTCRAQAARGGSVALAAAWISQPSRPASGDLRIFGRSKHFNQDVTQTALIVSVFCEASGAVCRVSSSWNAGQRRFSFLRNKDMNRRRSADGTRGARLPSRSASSSIIAGTWASRGYRPVRRSSVRRRDEARYYRP